LLARPKDSHEGKHQPPLRGELPVDLAGGEADRIPLEGRESATPLLELAAGEETLSILLMMGEILEPSRTRVTGSSGRRP
jgi:hypothetical protein